MRNFDDARRARRDSDREFQLGGEVFEIRASVPPEVLAEWDEFQGGSGEMLKRIDGLVLSFLPEKDGDRYRALRARTGDGDSAEEDPIALADLEELAKWMIESVTGRPTGRPESSPPGPGANGTSSTAVSSLPAVVPA